MLLAEKKIKIIWDKPPRADSKVPYTPKPIGLGYYLNFHPNWYELPVTLAVFEKIIVGNHYELDLIEIEALAVEEKNHVQEAK